MKIEEPNTLQSVKSFHESFDHPVQDLPKIPDENRSSLRVSLIAEELQELQDGILNENIDEIADALCDLQYVLSGAILEFGLAEKFKELFDEVHRSNMSKACQTEEEAIATMNFYKKDSVQCSYKKKGNYFIVYRDSDKKILKSINYSPANLSPIILKK